MRLTGEDLEASAPGAGKRADFLLLAYKRGENPHPLQQKPMQGQASDLELYLPFAGALPSRCPQHRRSHTTV